MKSTFNIISGDYRGTVTRPVETKNRFFVGDRVSLEDVEAYVPLNEETTGRNLACEKLGNVCVQIFVCNCSALFDDLIEYDCIEV